MSKRFKIFRCPECGRLSLTSSRKRGRCPYCGSLISLTQTRVVARFQKAREASEYLRRLKSRRVKNLY